MKTYHKRSHQTHQHSLFLHYRKDSWEYKWHLHRRVHWGHHTAECLSPREASPSSPLSAYHSSSQPISSHKSASQDQMQVLEDIWWLEDPEGNENYSNIIVLQVDKLTAAVHWITSLQLSLPAFNLNNSPALLSSHSLLNFSSSSSWQYTPENRFRLSICVNA